jgi:hypothetical protein
MLLVVMSTLKKRVSTFSGTDSEKHYYEYAGDCQDFLFGTGIRQHEQRKLSWPRAQRHIEELVKKFALKGAQ